MNKLEELINELCPNGIESKMLEDITKEINIGINPRKFFKLNPNDATGFYVTVRELNGLQGVKKTDKTDLINEEAIKIIQARARVEVGDILFSNTGTVGKMALINEENKNWGINEGIYVIKPKNDIINSRFLYYYLNSNLAYQQYSKMFTGSTLKHITQKALMSINVPVPAIKVQCEIVRILDKFTELEAELEARKKQYEYYKNKLLNFDETANPCSCTHTHTHTHTHGYFYKQEIKWLTISDILIIKNGKDYKHLSDGNYPVYGTGGIITYVNSFVYDKPSVLIPRKGSLSKVYYVEEPFWNVDTIYYTVINSKIVIPKYIYYILSNMHLEKLNIAGGIPSLTQATLYKIKIPVPSLEVQEKLVNILNKFDKIINGISEGLPAEIEARQQQYEYYRDKILTFKELENE